MSHPLNVFIVPDVSASFRPPPLPDDPAAGHWHAPPARIACFADWQAFRQAGGGRQAAPGILATHRLGLRVPGGMTVVATLARECAASPAGHPWNLVLTAPAWERLQRLASVQGSPWPAARVEVVAGAAPAPLSLADVLAAHDHAGEAETTVRLALSELLAHGELATRELAEVLRQPPATLRPTLQALQAQGLAARHDGLWRIADAASGAVAAWLARIHLPT